MRFVPCGCATSVRLAPDAQPGAAMLHACVMLFDRIAASGKRLDAGLRDAIVVRGVDGAGIEEDAGVLDAGNDAVRA